MNTGSNYFPDSWCALWEGAHKRQDLLCKLRGMPPRCGGAGTFDKLFLPMEINPPRPDRSATPEREASSRQTAGSGLRACAVLSGVRAPVPGLRNVRTIERLVFDDSWNAQSLTPAL